MTRKLTFYYSFCSLNLQFKKKQSKINTLLKLGNLNHLIKNYE